MHTNGRGSRVNASIASFSLAVSPCDVVNARDELIEHGLSFEYL